MCGATSSQNQIEQQQQSFYSTMINQAQQVFGNSSQVFSNLMSTFQPVVAAGPSQQGFSPTELSALNSQAITGVGQGYNNAKEAVGDQLAAQGGGTAVLPGGAGVGVRDSLAENAANQTSSELNQISQANYSTGRQNYLNAVQGEMAAPGVFGTAGSYAGEATGAGNSAANTANQIASQQNSWVQAVTGALGGIAGAATTGGFNLLGNAASAAPSASGPNTNLGEGLYNIGGGTGGFDTSNPTVDAYV